MDALAVMAIILSLALLMVWGTEKGNRKIVKMLPAILLIVMIAVAVSGVVYNHAEVTATATSKSADVACTQ